MHVFTEWPCGHKSPEPWPCPFCRRLEERAGVAADVDAIEIAARLALAEHAADTRLLKIVELCDALAERLGNKINGGPHEPTDANRVR